MKDKVQNAISKSGGEIITLDYHAPRFEPILEFMYKDMFFSIAEIEDDNWECHYHSLSSTDFDCDIIEWDWELEDIVYTYIAWVDLWDLW